MRFVMTQDKYFWDISRQKYVAFFKDTQEIQIVDKEHIDTTKVLFDPVAKTSFSTILLVLDLVHLWYWRCS